MDIKDVTVQAQKNSVKSESLSAIELQGKPELQTSANSDVSVDLSDTEGPSSLVKARKAANDIISTVNLVADATSEVEKLVKSIDGIIQQANNSELPEKRLVVLEREANHILDAIKQKVDLNTAHGNPLAGDPINFEGEPGVAPNVNVQLPKHAKDVFGLDTIQLKDQNSIAASRKSVDQAIDKLRDLSSKVSETKSTVHKAVITLEVAYQNNEAAKAKVRDLDQALELAKDAKSNISRDSRQAFGSLSRLTPKSLDLLK